MFVFTHNKTECFIFTVISNSLRASKWFPSDDGHASRIPAEAETKTRQMVRRGRDWVVTPDVKMSIFFQNTLSFLRNVLNSHGQLRESSISYISSLVFHTLICQTEHPAGILVETCNISDVYHSSFDRDLAPPKKNDTKGSKWIICCGVRLHLVRGSTGGT